MGSVEFLESTLRKASHRYSTLQHYVIEIEKGTTGHALASDAIDPPAKIMHILLARSGTRLRYEVKGPTTALWITDTERVWLYRPDLREYQVESARAWIELPNRESGIQFLDWEFVSKFRLLSGMASRASVVRADVPRDAQCATTTILVKLSIDSARGQTTETLRIDPETGLVCQSISHSIQTARTASRFRTVTTWHYKQIGGEIDENLFVFSPPKHAKRVDRFRQPPPIQ